MHLLGVQAYFFDLHGYGEDFSLKKGVSLIELMWDLRAFWDLDYVGQAVRRHFM